MILILFVIYVAGCIEEPPVKHSTEFSILNILKREILFPPSPVKFSKVVLRGFIIKQTTCRTMYVWAIIIWNPRAEFSLSYVTFKTKQ